MRAPAVNIKDLADARWRVFAERVIAILLLFGSKIILLFRRLWSGTQAEATCPLCSASSHPPVCCTAASQILTFQVLRYWFDSRLIV
jgi:hypothetical protein